MTVPDMTASQLIREGLCDGNCLLAAGPSDACDCACKGLWHGTLGHTPVPDTAPHRRPAAAPQAGPALIGRDLDLVDLDQAHAELDELEQLTTEQMEATPA